MQTHNHLAQRICKYLDINDPITIQDLHELILLIDTKNYDRIKEVSWWIKEYLKEFNQQKIGHSKVLNAIAKSLDYKNHHHLSNVLTIPDYMTMTESREYRDRIVPKYLIQKLVNRAREEGLDSILPHNLPDDILMGCSIQFKCHREDDDSNTVSLLFLMVLIFLDYDTFIKGGTQKVAVSPEDLQDHLDEMGILVLLEEMRRLNIISMSLNDLPQVDDIFDKKRSISMEVLNHELFDSYSN